MKNWKPSLGSIALKWGNREAPLAGIAIGKTPASEDLYIQVAQGDAKSLARVISTGKIKAVK